MESEIYIKVAKEFLTLQQIFFETYQSVMQCQNCSAVKYVPDKKWMPKDITNIKRIQIKCQSCNQRPSLHLVPVSSPTYTDDLEKLNNKWKQVLAAKAKSGKQVSKDHDEEMVCEPVSITPLKRSGDVGKKRNIDSLSPVEGKENLGFMGKVMRMISPSKRNAVSVNVSNMSLCANECRENIEESSVESESEKEMSVHESENVSALSVHKSVESLKMHSKILENDTGIVHEKKSENVHVESDIHEEIVIESSDIKADATSVKSESEDVFYYKKQIQEKDKRIEMLEAKVKALEIMMNKLTSLYENASVRSDTQEGATNSQQQTSSRQGQPSVPRKNTPYMDAVLKGHSTSDNKNIKVDKRETKSNAKKHSSSSSFSPSPPSPPSSSHSSNQDAKSNTEFIEVVDKKKSKRERKRLHTQLQRLATPYNTDMEKEYVRVYSHFGGKFSSKPAMYTAAKSLLRHAGVKGLVRDFSIIQGKKVMECYVQKENVEKFKAKMSETYKNIQFFSCEEIDASLVDAPPQIVNAQKARLVFLCARNPSVGMQKAILQPFAEDETLLKDLKAQATGIRRKWADSKEKSKVRSKVNECQ